MIAVTVVYVPGLGRIIMAHGWEIIFCSAVLVILFTIWRKK